MKLRNAALLVLAVTASAAAPEGLSARGVILAKRPAASTYRLLLHRAGQIAEVSNNYEFRSGDKFTLEVSVNDGGGYLYVLNRTITGSPDRIRAGASRGIQLASAGRPTAVSAREEEELLANESASASEYRLVYPSVHRKVARGWVSIPNDDLFEMDNTPGIEQLLVIVSPKPLTSFTKALESISKAVTKSERAQAQQTVRTELAQMAANAETADPPMDARSIVIEDLPPQQSGGGVGPVNRTEASKPAPPKKRKPNAGAGAPVDAARPYLVELTLVHI